MDAGGGEFQLGEGEWRGGFARFDGEFFSFSFSFFSLNSIQSLDIPTSLPFLSSHLPQIKSSPST